MIPAFIVESKWTPVVAIGATALCVTQFFLFLKASFVVKKNRAKNVPIRCKSDNGHKDKVVAYVFDSPTPSISGSPFSTKLTAYLRFTGIPHTVKEAQFEKAPKGKVPYIEHDGSFFGDSQLIIRYLENTFDVSKMSVAALKDLPNATNAFVPFDRLSPADQGRSDAIRLICEGEVYWAVSGIRWCGDEGIGKNEALWKSTQETFFSKIPSVIRGAFTSMIRVSVNQAAIGQGFARHSPDDQFYLATRALRSLSVQLGDQDFMLGDFPAECDCIALGCVECCLDDSRWPNMLTDFVRKELPNLVQYVSRLRAIVFPDVSPGDLRPHSRDGVNPIKK